MIFCVLCNSPLTNKNDSKEHLIPNALGGRLKVKGFICTNCNNTTGHLWDAELSKQLNPICLLMGISRERGQSPSQTFSTVGGGKRQIHADGSSSPGRPTYVEKTTDRGIEVQVRARTMIEAKNMIGLIKSKYPQIDASEVEKNLQEIRVYDDDPLLFDMSIGGKSGGRSIVKSAVSLAVRSGVGAGSCQIALNYLRGDDTSPPFGYYQQKDLVSGRPEDRVFHCVAIQGDHQAGLLIGYVEYFSAFRILILLSDRYEGKDISEYYAVDPVNGEKVALGFNLLIGREELEATFRYERIPTDAMVKAFDSVMQLSQLRSFEREKSRVIEDAVDYGFKNCGAKPGEILTEKHVQTLSRLVIERMMPFIRRHIVRRVPPPLPPTS